MNLLEMQHVKKGFGENEVLKDISLSVAEGEVVSIIGPSSFRKIHPAAMRDTVRADG